MNKTEQKIIKSLEWLMVKGTTPQFFYLENNIICKYDKQDFNSDAPKIDSVGYVIFDFNGQKINNASYSTFNECLLTIALNLNTCDFNIIDLLLQNRKQ